MWLFRREEEENATVKIVILTQMETEVSVCPVECTKFEVECVY
jgi:hypothetical protein